MIKRFSITAKFTLLCIVITAVTTLVVSITFASVIKNYYIEREITRSRVNFSGLTAQIRDYFIEWDRLVIFSGTAVPFFVPHGGAFDLDGLESLLIRNKELVPDVEALYVTSLTQWWQPSGFAVFSDQWIPDSDWDNTSRGWFIAALQNPQGIAFAEPDIDANTKALVVTVSKLVQDDNNRGLGVIAADIRLDFLKGLVAQEIRALGQEMHVITKDGVFITHSNENAILRDNFFSDPRFSAYRNNILSGEEFYNARGGISIFSRSVPGTDWILVSTVPTSIELADLYSLLLRLGILTLALLAASGVIALLLVLKRVSRPITVMAKTLNEIANGDGDLTVMLPETGSDEIADAAKYFNQTIGKIRKLVVSIKDQAGALANIGNDLASNMTETAVAVNLIASNIQNIKSRVTNQSASVNQTNATMELVTGNIDKLSGQVDQQTDAVLQASQAIEEMLANIRSVTETLVNNADSVRELQESSENGRSSLQGVVSDIKEIARESAGLLEINTVMENIASQTNLLSMNAAIEAAHAGEAGKGFAVVASEIRKLAESSSNQSKTIGIVLKKIKESIDKITRSADSAIKNFEAIDNGVRTVADKEEVIRGAMEEQGEGSRQVLQASTQVSEITRQVKGGSQQMLEGSKEVIQESRNLEMVTQEISNGINEMAVGAEEVNRAVISVNELSGRNRENISVLVRAVSQFKV
ncbi:MAG: methyl-accepting chemotaxis protein [Treponema sp.]|nr:methyl-accepting chemotaxis protein [Treponema sp.]